MTLEELIQVDGVVAAWRWQRGSGKPAVLVRTHSIDQQAAELGAMYLEMMLRLAECECMLLAAAMLPEGFSPSGALSLAGSI